MTDGMDIGSTSSNSLTGGSNSATIRLFGRNITGTPTVRINRFFMRNSKAGWTPFEDNILAEAVSRFGGKKWTNIAECVPGRTRRACISRWKTVIDPSIRKGPWSKKEDDLLIHLVRRYGTSNWTSISEQISGRISKQCRERWECTLNPEINKGPWTEFEDRTISEQYSLYGNKWADIAKLVPGRTANYVKSRWNCLQKRGGVQQAAGSSSQPAVEL